MHTRNGHNRLAFCLLTLCLLLVPMAVNAETSVVQQELESPHHVSGNFHDSVFGGTKLASGTRVAIWAPEQGQTKTRCLGLVNNSDKDLFIPWRSPVEWSAFLRAAPSLDVEIVGCCKPKTATICDTPITFELGQNWVGTPPSASGFTPVCDNYNTETGDCRHYGISGNVYGPIYASALLDDATINYEVTYTCDNPSVPNADSIADNSGGAVEWIQTRGKGSCVPLDGACGANTGELEKLPDNLDDLCGPGSILTDLSGTGPWNWTCLGTPGKASAACHADLLAPPQCYDKAIWGTKGPKLPDPLCVVGTSSWPGYYPGTNSHFWSWTCKTAKGKISCGYTDTNSNSDCGAADGTRTVNAPATGLCDNGTKPTAVLIKNGAWVWQCGSTSNCTAYRTACGTASLSKLSTPPSEWSFANKCSGANSVSTIVDKGTYYAWTCYGTDGSSVACTSSATEKPMTDAECGLANEKTYTSAPTANLCAKGTMTSFSGSGPWTWTCKSSDGGENASCKAYSGASSGPAACGSANGTYIPNEPDYNLCKGGTPSARTFNGSGWTWTCSGSGDSVACSAHKCLPCSGFSSTAKVSTSSPVSASWTEYRRGQTGNKTKALTLSRHGNPYAFSVPASAAPITYCSPCFMSPASTSDISSAKIEDIPATIVGLTE